MTTVFPLPSPALPEFTTLLLKGPYHASAPIHLCLTHLASRPGSRAVLLTPSRDNFVAALRDLNDDWLNECGGYGAVTQVLSRVDVFYPPTPVHASLALSMLRHPRPETVPSQLEIPSPCLLLLHEFSSYFLDGENLGPHNLASYLSLLAHALSALRSLSEQASRPHVCLVLMDSRLDSFSMPVLKPPVDGPNGADLDGVQSDSSYRVAFLMFHYFEWVGTFEINECSDPFTYMLRLRETVRGDDGGDVVLKWRRIDGERRVFNPLDSVIYVHHQPFGQITGCVSHFFRISLISTTRKSSVQLSMSNPTHHVPSKSSLTITLTEPLVILRTADVAGTHSHSLSGGVAPASAVRGLLALDLSKASRISNIEVELMAISYSSWSEGLGTSEERKFFSATQIFFRAASSPSTRRSLSVDPNGFYDATESEHHQPPPPPPGVEPALPAPAPLYDAGDPPQRGGMRVRRRSSADHLVFQRDPVAHLSRPLAPSPLSFRPTTEEETTVHTPTSSHFVESPSTSISSLPHVETPSAPHIQARRSIGHSRASNLGESDSLSRSSSRHERGVVASPGPDGLGAKIHRSHASLNFGSIFGRGSRPGSPVHDEGRPESPQSNGRERGREKGGGKRPSLFPHNALGRMGEALGLEEEHKEVGDGWQEFKKGTYTFPISFEIPSHMPASLDSDGGSVTWKLVAKVRRPGVFTSNLTTTREVHVVSIPAETDVETTGDITIEKSWDDQLQYLFKVSGRVFPIGASFKVKMMFMPLAKVRLYRLAIDLEERVDSYVGGMNMTRSVTSAIPLLDLHYDDDTKPLLPLSSDDPLAFENSPLAPLRPLGANASDVVSDLLGPGPWPIRAVLRLPADCGSLHPTSRSGDCSVHITHTLRFTMRLSRGDDPATDYKTTKRKRYDVVVRTPVHILSCYARAEYTTLPRYSETLDESATLAPPAPSCPCAAERKRRAREGADRSRVEASPVIPAPPFGMDPSELLERTLVYERLVSGHESVLGDAPPAYDAGPHPHSHSPHSSVISV